MSEMELNKYNIEDWKKELNKKAEPYFGENYANCLSDKEWLEDFEGDTTQEVIENDIQYCL